MLFIQRWALVMLASLPLTGCEAEEPVLPQLGPAADAGAAVYADLVVSFTENGTPITCTEVGSAICGQPAGPCTDHPALGEPDSLRFELQGEGVLELGFLCTPIVDRSDGGAALVPDFRIWSSVGAETRAVVAISQDGSTYESLADLSRDDQDFHITDANVDFVRFVRISGVGGAAISIDAVEVLQ